MYMCICTYTSACSVTVEIVGTGRLAAEIMAVITAKVNSPHALGSGLPLEGIDKLSFKWNKS